MAPAPNPEHAKEVMPLPDHSRPTRPLPARPRTLRHAAARRSHLISAEVTGLRAALNRARLSNANLAAAALASMAAHDEGEADPLSYLRDELAAQGFQGRPA